MTTQQSDSRKARARRSSGATAMIAAGIATFLTVFWVVPALLGFTVGGRHTGDDLLLLEIIVAAVPLAVGAFAVYQGKAYGRWVLLGGFILAVPESLPVLIIVGVVASVPIAKVAGIVAVLLAIAGIVLVSLPATGRFLSGRKVAGIPVR